MQDAPPSLQHLLPTLQAARADIETLRRSLARTVLGQETLIDGMILALLIGGHALLEGPPGVAKTLAVTSLAQSLGLAHKRVQGSPDLLPSDLIGTQLYNPGIGQFVAYKGPLFTNLLLFDEINRTPPKVQSALLEAMQERQVTFAQETHRLPDPFLVLATQNPFEHEGTYPLPDAQLDRFALHLLVGYPDPETELAILRQPAPDPDSLPAVLPPAGIHALQSAAKQVHLAEELERGIVDLVGLTRQGATGEIGFYLNAGVSPRASICWAAAARAHALMDGYAYVRPFDVATVAPLVLRHRVHLSFEAGAEGVTAEQVIRQMLALRPLA